jgi:hypothetical protein
MQENRKMHDPSPEEMDAILSKTNEFRLSLEGYILRHPTKITPKFLYLLTENIPHFRDFIIRNKDIGPHEKTQLSSSHLQYLLRATTHDFVKEFNEPEQKVQGLQTRRRFVLGGTAAAATTGVAFTAKGFYDLFTGASMRTKAIALNNQQIEELRRGPSDRKKIDALRAEATALSREADNLSNSGATDVGLGVGSLLLQFIPVFAASKMRDEIIHSRIEIKAHQRDAKLASEDGMLVRLINLLEEPLQEEISKMKNTKNLQGPSK